MRAKIELGDLKPRTSDDQTEALPPWRTSLRVCLSNIKATRDTIGTALLEDFREHPIPFCLRRAHSVRGRRLRRGLLSAHQRRTNIRLEGFTRTWRRGNVVRQA